jgi:outer membrane protein assembly factor BamA
MRSIFIRLALAFSLASYTEPANARPTTYVGEILIVGNAITQDCVIREAFQDLQPGQILRVRDVRRAKRKLARLGLFKNSTVQVLDSPGPFKDILVKVEEKQTATFRPMVQITPGAGLVLGFVIEERNFDPLRFPTSMADFGEGKVFRGAGQKWRLEFGVAPLLPSRIPLSGTATARPASFPNGLELLPRRP